MNKYKKIMFFSLLISIFFPLVSASNNFILNGKIIYIDAGHGGKDPGAVYKDINEDKINLEISYKLKTLLEKSGANVYMTRIDDSDLSDSNAVLRKRSDLYNRSKKINESDCDLYISIHLNAEPSNKWTGGQVFYDSINSNNVKLANYIQESFNNKLKSTRKIKNMENGYMYKRIKKTGVLVEAGFISNSNERYLLQQDNYQIRIAETIIMGIEKYFYKN